MGTWRNSGPRMAATAGLGLAALLCSVMPAQAENAEKDPVTDSDQWGVVLDDTKDCVQADAWVARLKGVAGIIDIPLFESHYPGIPRAGHTQAGGADLINLTDRNGVGLGKASALFTRAMGHQTPAETQGGKFKDFRGSSYAEAGLGTIEVGLPLDTKKPKNDGGRYGLLGVEVGVIDVSAWSKPKQAIEFTGGAAGGSLNLAGVQVLNVPPLWGVNVGLSLPPDHPELPWVSVMTNEQVTTDKKGVPTRKAGTNKYQYDTNATSGYINAIHLSLFGTNVADLSLGHAAVIRDKEKTDKYANPYMSPNEQQAWATTGGKAMPRDVREARALPKGTSKMPRSAKEAGALPNRSQDPNKRYCSPFAPPKHLAPALKAKMAKTELFKNC
ncbi:hypothetical protein ACFQVC_22675 [Streptomyces monticola]|uniref:Uncharacterized protein n=1 Tax=Streptomyces monticola TaxID=2666263 RepID=A0ABW2JMT9_9ACTN